MNCNINVFLILLILVFIFGNIKYSIFFKEIEIVKI